MNEIQRAINTLSVTALGGAAALAKGAKSMFRKNKPGKESASSETADVLSSLGYTTQLSSDEAAQKAAKSANEMILQKVRSKNLRDAKTGRFVRLYKEPEGGKK